MELDLWLVPNSCPRQQHTLAPGGWVAKCANVSIRERTNVSVRKYRLDAFQWNPTSNVVEKKSKSKRTNVLSAGFWLLIAGQSLASCCTLTRAWVVDKDPQGLRKTLHRKMSRWMAGKTDGCNIFVIAFFWYWTLYFH